MPILLKIIMLIVEGKNNYRIFVKHPCGAQTFKYSVLGEVVLTVDFVELRT